MPALAERELSLTEQKAREPKILTDIDIKKQSISRGRYAGFFAGVCTGEYLFFSAMCTHPALFILPLLAAYAGGEVVRHEVSLRMKYAIHGFFCGKRKSSVPSACYIDGVQQWKHTGSKPSPGIPGQPYLRTQMPGSLFGSIPHTGHPRKDIHLLGACAHEYSVRLGELRNCSKTSHKATRTLDFGGNPRS